MFSAITQLRIYCDTSMGPHAQQELTSALSTTLGTVSSIPQKDRVLNTRLLQIQAAIIATRRRFMGLAPECLWVVVHGSAAETRQALEGATPDPMYKVTELRITPVTTNKIAA